MPKSRNRKNHKAKVAARNQRIKETQNRVKNVLRKQIAEKYKEELAAEATQGVEHPTGEDVTPPDYEKETLKKLEEQLQNGVSHYPSVWNPDTMPTAKDMIISTDVATDPNAKA